MKNLFRFYYFLVILEKISSKFAQFSFSTVCTIEKRRWRIFYSSVVNNRETDCITFLCRRTFVCLPQRTLLGTLLKRSGFRLFGKAKGRVALFPNKTFPAGRKIPSGSFGIVEKPGFKNITIFGQKFSSRVRKIAAGFLVF